MDEPADQTRPLCVEHVWQLAAVAVTDGGLVTDYECVRCPERRAVPPGGLHPSTV